MKQTTKKISEKFVNCVMSEKNREASIELGKLLKTKCEKRILKVLKKLNLDSKK